MELIACEDFGLIVSDLYSSLSFYLSSMQMFLCVYVYICMYSLCIYVYTYVFEYFTGGTKLYYTHKETNFNHLKKNKINLPVSVLTDHSWIENND